MKNNKTFVAFALCLFMTTISIAQPGFEETVDDVAPIPGILLAIAVAVGLGVRKTLKSRK